MAGVNIDNVGLTFINYLEGVDRSLNDKSKARTLFKTQHKDWTGAQLEWRVHVKRSGAIQAIDDGGALPVANRQQYTAAKVGRKMTSGSLQLTDGVMATASGSKYVAKDVLESEMEGLMTEFLNFENFFLYRNGDGVVATAQSGTSGTTLKVNDARGLWDGVDYDVYDSTLATFRGTITISSVANDPDASTGYGSVTLTASVPTGTIATDKIVWKNSASKVMSGLEKLITDSGTIQNISATSFPRHTSFVFDNSGTARDLTPSLYRQLQAVLAQRASSDPNEGLTVIGSADLMVTIDELYESQLRVTPDSDTGGLAMPQFQSSLGKFKVLSEKDAPYGKLWFCDFGQLHRGVQKKLGWRTDKNGAIFKRSDTAAVYTATALEISELYIRERNSSAVITDLTTPNKFTAW